MTPFDRFFARVLVLLPALSVLACGACYPYMGARGEYMEFTLGQAVYDSEADQLWFYLQNPSFLPVGVSTANMVCPSAWRVEPIRPPEWAKDHSRLNIDVVGLSRLNQDEALSFDIVQGGKTKQHVTILITPPPDVWLTRDGHRCLATHQSLGTDVKRRASD